MTITWQILLLERELSDGGVYQVHWDCSARAEGLSARRYGAIAVIADPESPDFIAYDDLTENDCLGWVWAQVSKDDTEAGVAAELEAIKNPTTGTGVPWPTNPQEGE